MDIFISDTLIKTFRTVITGTILTYLFFQGKKNNLKKHQGWHYILAGFGLIFIGSLIDLIVKSKEYTAHIEKTADTIGPFLLVIGFYKWLPLILEANKTRKELQGRDKFFQSIVENIPDYVMRYDKQHRHIFANSKTFKANNKTAEEFIGKTHREMGFNPDLCAVWEKAIDRVFETGIPQQEVFEWENAFSEKQVLDWRIYPEFDIKGNIETVLGISRDITEQIKAERELEKIFNLSVDMICIADTSGYFKKVNPAFSKTLGYTEEELLKRPFLDFVHPEDRDKTLDIVKENILLGRSVRSFVNRYICKDSSIKWLEWTSQPIVSEGVDFAIARDITKRKKSEGTLARSELRFQSFMRNFPGLAYIKDSDGMVIFVNEGFRSLLGLNPDDIPGKTNFDLFPPGFAEKITQDDRRVLEYGQNEMIEESFNGRHWVTYKFLIPQPGAKPLLGGFTIDNSERKSTEEQLRKSREMLVKAEQIGRMGCWDWDIATNNVVWSNEVYRIYGLDPAKDVPSYQLVIDTICPEYKDAFLKAIEDTLKHNKPFGGKYCIILPDKTKRYTHTKGEIIFDDENNPVKLFGIVQDITEQKQAEKELKDLLFKYRIVSNNTSNWEFWLDPEGRFVYTSPSCKTITGHTVEEFMSDHTLLSSIVHPEDRLHFDDHQHKALHEQKPGTAEFRIICPDKTIRWIDHVCQPVIDKEGRFLGARGSNRDITEKKMMEQELFKIRNLESLGILAGGIAHDFNNLLQGLLGNISLAKLNISRTSKAFVFLDSAEGLYNIASGLTNQLLAFATGGISSIETIQLPQFITKTITFSLSGSNIKPAFDLSDDLLNINADAGQLHQVLSNVVFNARDAMPSGGIVQVSAKNELLLHGDKKHFIKPGKYVRISIKDHGTGIAQEHLSRIFDPYFSTKERGSIKGMGLGLTISDAIVRKHGGMIKVASEPGSGTTVHIFLPAEISEAKNMRLESAHGQDEPIHAPRILIMDDEPAVFEVAIKFLALSGYRVDLSTNGEDAVNAYKASKDAGDPYEVVILDLTIPGGIGGKEVISILREIDPGVKAIVSSGYAHDPVFTDYALYGFSAGIAKPYPLEALKEIIENLIAR